MIFKVARVQKFAQRTFCAWLVSCQRATGLCSIHTCVHWSRRHTDNFPWRDRTRRRCDRSSLCCSWCHTCQEGTAGYKRNPLKNSQQLANSAKWMSSTLQTSKCYSYLHLFTDIWIIVDDYSQHVRLLHLSNESYFTLRPVNWPPGYGRVALVP